MNNYLAGDFMSVPDGTTAAGYLVPTPPLASNPPFNTGNNQHDDSGDRGRPGGPAGR